MQTPEEEKFLQTKDELVAKIKTFMGGRAAEELVFKTVTSGAANDIEQATAIARNMVMRFGMSETFGMMGLATVESQYLEGRAALNCGDKTASEIDEEVNTLINGLYKESLEMLEENREILDGIADYLYENETITGKEFMKKFRALKGIEDEDDNAEIFEEDEFFVEEDDDE